MSQRMFHNRTPLFLPAPPPQELCQKIMAGGYNAPEWMSAGARDLLSRMLLVDPERRATFKEVAAHPWTRGAGPTWERPLSSAFVVEVDRETGG